MKGKPEIIDLLNEVLTAELTAINQYFIHAKLCQNWGFLKLAEKIRAESIDEMKHADELIDRILYLEGIPNLQRYHKLQVGESVPEALKADLAFEYQAIAFLNASIPTVRDLGDHGTEELLRDILVGEEVHTDWLETQLHLIEKLGEAGYLAEQL